MIFFVYIDTDSLVEGTFLNDINNWRRGATKLCIPLEEFVLKRAICGEKETGKEGYIEHKYEEDSMETEFNVYQQVKNNCMQDFFAETIYLGNNIYAQEKCAESLYDSYYWNKTYFERKGKPYSFKSFTSIDELTFSIKYAKNGLHELSDIFTDSLTQKAFMEFYSIAELTNLQHFLCKYDINDIHSDNCGFFKTNQGWKLKIFDYSGFQSNTGDLCKKNSIL